MKNTFVLVLILSVVAASLSSRQLFIINDIPSCIADIESDFANVEDAIAKKNWTDVMDLLKRVTKTYIDCKDAYNQVGLCMNDVKGIVSNLFDLFDSVKSHDMNPVHYWNYVKGIYTGVKSLRK